MSDDYLWDGSGEPDPDVEQLEGLLGRYRHAGSPPDVAAPKPRPWLALLAVAATLVIVVGAGWMLRSSAPRASFDVERVAGAPRVGSSRVASVGSIEVGEWLETDGASRARMTIADIGQVEVEPNTRVGLIATGRDEHRLSLERGKIHAITLAPPRQFFVDTPSGTAVDLGCAFTLETDERGVGLLAVSSGWVAFERDGVSAVVPAQGRVAFDPQLGPGTPYHARSSQQLRDALREIDFENGGADSLEVILREADRRDALSLWYLLHRFEGDERSRLLDGLQQLAPLPTSVELADVQHLDASSLDRWRDDLERLWRD